MKNVEVNIRVAEKDDQINILNLLNNVFSENQRSNTKRDTAYWQWKFTSNIFGRSILNVAEVNGKIVGFDHLWPWELKCGEDIIKAYQPCDSVVAAGYRGQSIFNQLRKKGIEDAVEHGARVLFNFPNKNSLGTNIRTGAKSLGKISWWIRILKPIQLAKEIMFDSLASISEISSTYDLDILKLEQITKEYEMPDRYIVINRKVGFYEWRYKHKPNRHYGMISIERNNKAIAAIFTINQKEKIREMVIVDIVGHTALSNHLLGKIVEVAKSLEATFLAVIDNQQYDMQQLWKRGFIKKKNKNLVALPIDLSIKNKIINIKNWCLIAGMHDSI